MSTEPTFDIDAAQQLCDKYGDKGVTMAPTLAYAMAHELPDALDEIRRLNVVLDEAMRTNSAGADDLDTAWSTIDRLRAQVQRVEALCDQSDAATGEFSWLGLDSESVRAAALGES